MDANVENTTEVPDFSGKVLSFTLIDDEDDRDLVDPRFVMQAGRLFLVGVVPASATGSDWSAGATGAVAWDRVTSYLAFDSIEQYQAALSVSREYDVDDSEST